MTVVKVEDRAVRLGFMFHNALDCPETKSIVATAPVDNEMRMLHHRVLLSFA